MKLIPLSIAKAEILGSENHAGKNLSLLLVVLIDCSTASLACLIQMKFENVQEIVIEILMEAFSEYLVCSGS